MSAQEVAFLCCDDSASDAQGCEHTSRYVYFCIRLSEGAVETSAVLDGLCSAPGVATLPAVVSEEDFLLWSKCDPSSPPEQIEDLVKVLRVADALSDKRAPAWVKVMAERTGSTHWLRNTGGDLFGESWRAEPMHAALLSLSPNVRTSVLRHFIDREPDALGLLPETLHPYVVAAMIGSDGALRCPLDEGLHLKFLSQLRALPGCGHPPLQSLDLMYMEAQPSTCHVIVDALPCHTRLSSLLLNLPYNVPEQISVMNVLCSSLAAATSLREIRLDHRSEQGRIPLSAFAPLVRALPALPSLERLHLDDIALRPPQFLIGAGPADAPPTLADTDELRGHWWHLLAAVASHPGLTCLSLACVYAFKPLPWPEAFPRLQELNLEISFDCPDTDSVRLEAAVSKSRKAPTRPPHFPVLSRLVFMSSSPKCAALAPLAAVWLPISKDSPPGSAMRRMDLHVEDLAEEEVTQFWQEFACVVDCCPGLEGLSLLSAHHDIMAAIVCPHLGAKLRSLRNTSIRSLHLEGCNYTATSISPEQASEAATAIHSLSSLRSLSLDAVRDPTCCYALRAVQNLAVGSLPDLTRLCFHMRADTDADTRSESTAGVVEALQTRTALRSVDMGSWVLSPAVAQQLWDALVSMPHLQELALQSTKVPKAAVRGLAAALPRMTALTFLDMRPVQSSKFDQRSRDGAVVELLAGELGRRGAVRRLPLRLVYSCIGYAESKFKEFEQAAAAVNVHCVHALPDY